VQRNEPRAYDARPEELPNDWFRFLAAAGRALTGSLDPKPLMADLGALIVPSFADYYHVLIAQRDRFQTLCVVDQDVERLKLVRQVTERYPIMLFDPAVASIVGDPRPILLPDITETIRRAAAKDETHFELLQRIARSNTLRLHLTVTTTDTQLARLLEPRAPRPDLRLEAIRRLRAAGLDAGILCCPVLPRITDSHDNLDSVVLAAKQVDACFVSANPVYFSESSLAVYMPFIRERFPQHVAYYEAKFSAETPFVSKLYADQLRAKFLALCRKHGMLRRDEYEEWNPPTAEPQMRLFA